MAKENGRRPSPDLTARQATEDTVAQVDLSDLRPIQRAPLHGSGQSAFTKNPFR
jgi:hypothetical protein